MITVHSGFADDFSSLGLCSLTPTDCTVEEQAGGMFQLKMTHPMDKTGRWWYLQKWNIIKAPAPMRETPLLTMNQTASTTVTRKVYEVNVSSRLRLRTKPSTSKGKIIGRYKDGVKVVRIGENGDWYQVIVKSGGATGWMHSDYLKYVGEETEVIPGDDKPGTVVEPRQTRDQLFRIMTVDRDDAEQCVYITAVHVFYDLSGNIVNKDYTPEGVAAAEAGAFIFANTIKDHDFAFYSNTEAPISGEYRGKSVVSALIENEGIVQQAQAKLVRDNFDVFLLQDEPRDRGVEVRRGKNLVSAVLTEDVSEVVTGVIPIGRDKNGKPLRITSREYVEAPNAAEIPVPRIVEMEYDVKSGSDEFKTDAAARTELERLAELEFTEKGINYTTVGLQVDFVALEKIRKYQQYAHLQAVHLYDLVRVYSGRSKIDAKVRVTAYVYDCLKKRYRELTLGELFSMTTTVNGFDITPGTISGNRLVAGTVSGSAIRDAEIYYAKIAQAAIEQLNADSITAVRAHIHDLVAGNITTDQLYADFAKIATLEVAKATFDYANIKDLDVGVINALIGKFGEITSEKLVTDELYAAFAEIINLSAENLQADKLTAALGNFVTMYAGTGEFDFATIRNLVAKAMALEQGSMDTVYIRNLAVTSANLLSATLGKLVIKGDDGKYYRVFVTSTGEIRTEEVTVSEGEIGAGQTDAGQQIVETTLNVGDLNAGTIQGSSAVINEILTVALNAEKITAADALIASATITELYATSIRAIGDSLDLSANISIQTMVGSKATVYRSETPPTGANANDLWIQPSTGYTFQLAGDDGLLPGFYADEDGNLYYAYGEGQEEYALTMDENGDLYAADGAPFAFSIGDDGRPVLWQRVRDSEWAGAIDSAETELENKISSSYSELEQRADSFEASINTLTTDGNELRTYLRYGDGVLELGRSDSDYTAQMSDKGFEVLQEGGVMASMKQNTITAPVIAAQRMFTIGEHTVRLGASGHLIFN